MSDFLSNIVERSLGRVESIRPLIRPLFASMPDVALDASLLVPGDPQTRLSEIDLQPATVNEPTLPVNLVASRAPSHTPQPGSLLRRTPQPQQGGSYLTEPAATEELTLLMQPSVEPAMLLITQTQVDGSENEFSTLPDTGRTIMASAAQDRSSQRTFPVTNMAPTATPQASKSQIQPQGVSAQPSPSIMPVPASASLLANAKSERDETSYVISMDIHKDPPMQRTTLPVQHEPPVKALSNTQYLSAAEGQPITMDVNQNQQVNTLETLATTMLTTPIVSKSFSQPVSGSPLITVSRALDTVIRQQIDPRQPIAAVAPVLQPVEQGQTLLISSVQDTGLTMTAGSYSDESLSSTHFVEVNQDTPTHLRERSVLAPLASIQPQITASIEDQHTGVSALEQEASQEEQTLLIRVSIGRVEVRATPPSVSLPTAKPAPRPALSLNDYLVQRRKGIR